MDEMAEMLTGEKGAVRCIGKFYISPRMGTIEGMPLVMVAGAVVSPCGGKLVLPENAKYAEMWECEIIIIPKRKYSSLDEGGKPPSGRKGGKRFSQDTDPECFGIPFNGYRIDQVLCGNYGDPEAWGRKYFDSKTP